MTHSAGPAHDPWPARSWLLAGVGAAAGAVFGLVLNAGDDTSALSLTFGTFVFTGFVALALVLERRRWPWAVAAALGVGVVLALIGWNTAQPSGSGWEFGWPFASATVAGLILLPLFQTVRDEGAWRLPPGPVHAHVWADVVIGAVGLAFVGVALLLVVLIDQLLRLVGIAWIQLLWSTPWFGWALAGAAFGAVAARLRDRAGLLGTLLTVKFAVLAVLAPVLAVGVALFLAALPFGGLATFWNATGASTPILLACAGLSVWLLNAVIGGERGEGAGGRMLRIAALALALVILPLAAIGAAGLWIRVADLGWTPTRLWGVAAIGVALVWGGAYLWTVVRARGLDERALFAANVRLAVGVAAVALLLATPLVDFGAVSARDQIARLRDGRVTAERFDWSAMAFDFGPAGQRALTGLTGSRVPAIATAARQALAADDRYQLQSQARRDQDDAARRAIATRTLRTHPAGLSVPADLRQAVFGGAGSTNEEFAADAPCDYSNEAECALHWAPGADAAVVTQVICREGGGDCDLTVTPLVRSETAWLRTGSNSRVHLRDDGEPAGSFEAERAAVAQGRVSIRPVTRRQVFVGDRAVGDAFE